MTLRLPRRLHPPRDDQIVHFDDVPYLHQHLLANLPDAVMGDITERIAPYEEDETTRTAGTRRRPTTRWREKCKHLSSFRLPRTRRRRRRASRVEPRAAACGDASCRQRLGCRLRLHAVSSPALGADATSAAFLAELPAVELAAPLAVLPPPPTDGAGDDDGASGGLGPRCGGERARRLHRSSARAAATPPPLHRQRDGATLAAAAAAVAVGAPALNVCDDAAARFRRRPARARRPPAPRQGGRLQRAGRAGNRGDDLVSKYVYVVRPHSDRDVEHVDHTCDVISASHLQPRTYSPGGSSFGTFSRSSIA